MKMSNVFEFEGGEIQLWIEQESLHMRACSGAGDPIEITSATARDLAEKLKELADLIDG